MAPMFLVPCRKLLIGLFFVSPSSFPLEVQRNTFKKKDDECGKKNSATNVFFLADCPMPNQHEKGNEYNLEEKFGDSNHAILPVKEKGWNVQTNIMTLSYVIIYCQYLYRYMSNRLEKVNSLLAQEISKIIAKDFGFKDALVTLTHVDATANLIEARVYVSVMPSASALGSGETKEDKIDQVIKSLNNDVYNIQQKLNKMLNMRPIPRIKFVKDPRIAEAARIEGLLAQLKKEER